ncbi:MAG TPA: hypothetical protein VGG39_14815 [Polyangiaceae bacterium]|jgi:hypothetical protein
MKPVAPSLPTRDALHEAADDEASIHSEVLRLCDAHERGERITLPAPPSPETLRMATAFPPSSEDEHALDTIPSPPPSTQRRRTDVGDDAVPSTIPGPPPVPRIIGL